MTMSKHENILFHFLTSSKYRFQRHLLFGLILLPIALAQSFFVLGNLGIVQPSTIYIFGIGFWGFLLGLVYLNIFYLTPRFIVNHQYTLYGIGLFAAVFLTVIVKFFMESYLLKTPRMMNYITLLDWISNATLYMICISSSSITTLIRVWSEENEQIQKLEHEHVKKDIEEFKHRISPEMLYSALTKAAEKTTKDPEHASNILFQLSKVLRYQLYDCNRTQTLFDAEITFVENYMQLQQYSMYPNCNFSIQVQNEIRRFIPPGLYKSMLEIILAEQPTEIHMVFTLYENQLTCTCTCLHKDTPKYNVHPLKQRLNQLETSYELEINKSTITLSLC